MSKFIYLYKGPRMEMTPEQGAAWGAWMGKLGASLIDQGAPFGSGSVVVDDGSSAKISDLTGYTLIEAADLQAAKALTAGNPLLADKKGQQMIEIFELVEM